MIQCYCCGEVPSIGRWASSGTDADAHTYRYPAMNCGCARLRVMGERTRNWTTWCVTFETAPPWNSSYQWARNYRIRLMTNSGPVGEEGTELLEWAAKQDELGTVSTGWYHVAEIPGGSVAGMMGLAAAGEVLES